MILRPLGPRIFLSKIFFFHNYIRLGIFCAFIVILGLAVYWRSFDNDFINWDDPINVVKNPLIRNFSWQGLKDIFVESSEASKYYIPLTFLSYFLEYAHWGMDPAIFHKTNLILHLFNALLIFWLFMSMGQKAELAFVGATLFVVHPLNVESVAWISERKGLLSALFLFPSLTFYLKYRHKGSQSFYAYSLLLFAFSLLSKPGGLPFPFVLLAVDYLLGRQMDRKVIYDKLPFLILTGLVAVLTWSGQEAGGALRMRKMSALGENLIYATYGFLFYLWKFLIPTRLSALYPYPEHVNFVIPLLFLGIVGCIWYFRKNREIVFGFLFFILIMLPVSKIIPFGHFFTADRFMYIPSFGLIFMVIIFLRRVFVISGKLGLWVKIFSIITMTLVGSTFSFLARERTQVWQDSLTFWQDVLKNNPNTEVGHTNLGVVYLESNKLDKAIFEFKEAVRIKPDDPHPRIDLGIAYVRTGMLDEAIAEFKKALALDPNDGTTHSNLAMAYLEKKEYALAIKEVDRAIELKWQVHPDFLTALEPHRPKYR